MPCASSFQRLEEWSSMWTQASVKREVAPLWYREGETSQSQAALGARDRPEPWHWIAEIASRLQRFGHLDLCSGILAITRRPPGVIIYHIIPCNIIIIMIMFECIMFMILFLIALISCRLYCMLLYYSVLYCPILHQRIILYYSVSYCTILCDIRSCHIISYYVSWYHILVCYIISYYIILYHTMV